MGFQTYEPLIVEGKGKRFVEDLSTKYALEDLKKAALQILNYPFILIHTGKEADAIEAQLRKEVEP